MKSKFILFSLVTQLAFSQGGSSQKYDTQVINQEILESLYEKNDLQGAINELSKTPFLHPDYLDNQITIIGFYNSLDKKEEALKICKNLLDNKLIDANYKIPLAFGSLLSDNKEYDKALEQFDVAHKFIPNSPVLRYNYALVYYRKGEVQKAINILQENLTYFPYHSSSLYMLGKIALEDNNFATASSAFLTYLLTNPNGVHAKYILQILDKKTSSYYAAPSKYKYSASGDNFEEFDLIFKNDFPLNKGYKLRMDLNEIYSRNLQAIFDYYKDHNFKNGFTETNFGKWIANVAQTNKIKEVTYYTLSGLLDTNPKIFGKNEKEILKYIQSEEFFNLFKLYSTKNINGVKTHITLSDNLYKYATYPEKFYDVENFDGKLYHPNGILKREFSYRNGINTGILKEYDDKGILVFEANLENDNNYTYINYNSSTKKIESKGTFVNQEKSGIKTIYDIFGNKTIEENYKNDVYEGLAQVYFVDGSLKAKREYKNGKYNGIYEYNNSNNKIIAKGNYYNDEPSGKVEYYFVNGDVKGYDLGNNGKMEYSETRNVLGNVITKQYFNNGVIAKNENFNHLGKLESVNEFDKNGKIIKSQIYDNNGNLFYEDFFKNEELSYSIQYTATNPKGEKIIPKGEYLYKDYLGNLISSTTFKSGKIDGVKKYFNSNGYVTTEELYTKNVRAGLSKSYYSNGSLYTTSMYSDDKKNGIETAYSVNGNVISQTNYVDGEIDGMVTLYYPNGKVSSYSFYKHGQLDGKYIELNLTGEIERISYYSKDQLYKRENYIGGKLYSVDDRIGRTGTHEIKRSDAEVYSNTTKNGILHGESNRKLTDGTLLRSSNYKNGKLQGAYKEYNAIGTLISSKYYEADLLQGENISYDIVGNILSKTIYKNNTQVGVIIHYYPNGSVFQTVESFDDKDHGETLYYNYNGQAVLAIGYENNQISYYKILEGNKLGNPINYVLKSTQKIISKYENGKTAVNVTINKGVVNDTFEIFDPNGSLIYEAVYKNSTFSKITMNHENGKNYYIKNFENNEREGNTIFYDTAGNKLVEENHLSGYLHGKSIFYKNGVAVKTLNYDSDVITSLSK